MDSIQHLVFYLKHEGSEPVFCLRLEVETTQVAPIERASFCLQTPTTPASSWRQRLAPCLISQAVLNTFTENYFQDAFKNGRSGNGAHARNRITSRIMVAIRPKVSFDQRTALVPEIIDDSLYKPQSLGNWICFRP
jgi:hypothetical protein